MKQETYDRAKKLRKDLTDAEYKLWSSLRSRRFSNYKFRRQVPVADYVVDFLCFSAKLIVELDGDQHAYDTALTYDQNRTDFLIQNGYTVQRYWNYEVLYETEWVLEDIYAYLASLK